MNVAAKQELQQVQAAPLAPATESTALISMIERAARDPAVDIDKMERLMKMHTAALERQAKTAFDAALALMQPELPIIDRKGRIEIRAKDAKTGERTGAIQQSTKYALWEDINEAICPILSKHGFALSFRPGNDDKGLILVTGILSHREGHREEGGLSLQHDSTGSKNAVQAVKSSISYGKRILAEGLLNITSRGQDDDGKSTDIVGKVTDAQAEEVKELIVSVGADIQKFLTAYQIEKVEDLPASRFDEAKTRLNAFGRSRK